MTTTNNTTSTTTNVLTFVEPRNICLSKDKEYVLIFLENGVVIRKHVNLFKHVLGVKFKRKTPAAAGAAKRAGN